VNLAHGGGAALALLLIVRPFSGWAQGAMPPLAINPDTATTRELAAVIAERDRQYAQRFEAQQQAVNSALAAQDKATAAAFAAAEKAVAAALAAQEKATAAAFSAANTAVSKAELANEKRLDNVNEFRAQLKDQAATLATRSEVQVQMRALDEKLNLVTTAQTEMRSRSEGATGLWTVLAAGAGLLIGIAMAGLAVFRKSRHDEAKTEAA
jgi:hypothetical protein